MLQHGGQSLRTLDQAILTNHGLCTSDMTFTLHYSSLLSDLWLQLADHQATIGVSESGLKAVGNLAGPNSLSPSVGSYALGPQGLGSSDSAGISPCSRAQPLAVLLSYAAYESACGCKRLPWGDAR